MRRILFCFASALFLIAAPIHAAKRAFTIEDLYRYRHVEDMHLSPDGRMIVLTLAAYDLGKGKAHESHLVDGRGRRKSPAVHVRRGE